MSLTFPTTDLKKPSGLTALPSGLKRPAFGTLYGFDAQGGSSAGYTVTYIDTLANIRAIADATTGQTAYATDTHDLYVYDGVNWAAFQNDL
jgi:hypothetical protein